MKFYDITQVICMRIHTPTSTISLKAKLRRLRGVAVLKMGTSSIDYQPYLSLRYRILVFIVINILLSLSQVRAINEELLPNGRASTKSKFECAHLVHQWSTTD